jgi:hypothetical protein
MITREEAIERVELYLRRQGFEVATRQLTEEIVEAIGAWEEEDKPPELPDGWSSDRAEFSPTTLDVFVHFEDVQTPGGTQVGRGFWMTSENLPFLARALAALRRDDGEVELMVPLDDLLGFPPSPFRGMKTAFRQMTVSARRVRP